MPRNRWLVRLCFLFLLLPILAFARNIPILCYHNFNPTLPGSMNLTPAKLEAQIKWLKDNGFTVIPLKTAVAYLEGKNVSLPAKPVVITADDGWKSVYTYLYPLAKKYNVPITLFIYPQTISSGKNAMTWAQLKILQESGLFTVESHTYWHPNFKKEKRKRSSESYQNFVLEQLKKSKDELETHLGTKVTLLAWPFGIYNAELEAFAKRAGYEMAFTIDARYANRSFRPMAQPRFMIVDDYSMKAFARIMNASK